MSYYPTSVMLRFIDTALGDEDRPAVSLVGPVLSAIPPGNPQGKGCCDMESTLEPNSHRLGHLREISV